MPRTGVLANLRWGALWGLLFGVIYVVILMILFVLQGPALFRGYDTTFGAVAALYLAGGVASGMVVGILRPLLKWRWGAALAGIFAAIPIGLAAEFMLMDAAVWSTKDTWVVIIFAVALGAPVGWMFWGIFRTL